MSKIVPFDDNEEDKDADFELQEPMDEDDGGEVDQSNEESESYLQLACGGSEQPIVSVALCGDYVAAGSEDDLCRIYSLTTQSICEAEKELKPSAVLNRHDDTVSTCAFSQDGQYLATASLDAAVNIYKWDSDKGSATHAHHIDGLSEVNNFKWHHKAPMCLLGCNDGLCYLISAPEGKIYQTLAGLHSEEVTSTCFGGNKQQLICTASLDGSFGIWAPNAKDSNLLHSFRNFDSKQKMWKSTNGIHDLSARLTSPLVALGCGDASVRLINVETHHPVASFHEHEADVTCVSFCDSMESNDTHLLASGDINGLISIWDCGRESMRCSIKPLPSDNLDKGITSLHWDPNGSPILISTAADGFLRLHDVRSGEMIRKAEHPDSIMTSDVASYAGQSSGEVGILVATACDDSYCRLFWF